MAEAKRKKLSPEQLAKRTVTTSEFRVSYPQLFEAKEYKEGGAKRYSVEMLFDKKTTDLKPLQRALHAAKIDQWGPDKEEWPEGIKSPIRDGDKPRRNKQTRQMEVKDEHKGMWVLSAATGEKRKPTVYGRKKEDILEEDLYAGCYARAQLFAGAYEISDDNVGVKFYVNVVQKIKDGEPLGSRRNDRDAFGVIEDDGDNEESFDSFDEEAEAF